MIQSVTGYFHDKTEYNMEEDWSTVLDLIFSVKLGSLTLIWPIVRSIDVSVLSEGKYLQNELNEVPKSFSI